MSKYLSPKLIIAEAWELTRDHKKELFWYGFIPAFFGMIIGSIYMLYQVVALRNFFLNEQDTAAYGEIFQQTWDFITAESSPTGLLMVLTLFILLGYCTIPIFAKSSLILLIEQIKKGETRENGVQVGFLRFFPMLGFTAMRNMASPLSFLTEGSFVLRHLRGGLFWLLTPLLSLFILLGLVVLFFFSYVPQTIVLQKKGLIASIAKSAKLSFTYFSETFRLYLLILLIELRVLINIAFILVLPFIIVAISGFFSSTLFHGLGIVLSVIVGIILLSIAATISGTLEIFSTAIWTLAFHSLTPDEEKQTKLFTN